MTTITQRKARTPAFRHPTPKGVENHLRMVNSVRSSLVTVIKLQTGLDVKSSALRYFRIVDTWFKNEGKRSTVLRLKKVYTSALNSMVNQPITPEPWLSQNKRGFPRKFEFLETFVHKNGNSQEAQQAVLTLLGYYRMIIAPGIPDLSPITDEGPEIPDSFLDEILSLGFDPNWKLNIKELPPVEMLLRSKIGPNGQTTIGAFLDLRSLTDSMIESITGLSSFFGFEGRQFAQTVKRLRIKIKHDPKYTHSKLAVKQEKGGKDRVFAMVDYWSQCSLRPLHVGISKILDTIYQDCTMDQGKGVKDMLNWTLSGHNESIDLSSASDRFPLTLQVKLLEKLTSNPELVEHWRSIMVDRDYKYKGKLYRWKVGQPLGSYSSWPMFALSHHCVVRAAFAKAKVTTLEYYLLGDDLVIRNPKAALEYRRLIDKLGIKVSESKSLIGKPIEFAKRIFNNGKEISPSPAPMIQSTIKDKCLLPETVSRLVERSSDPHSDLRVRDFADRWAVINRLSIEETRVLCEYPRSLQRSWISHHVADSRESSQLCVWSSIELPLGKVVWIHELIKFKYLMEQYLIIEQKSSREARLLSTMELPGTPTSFKRQHPMFLANDKIREDISEAKSELRAYISAPRRSEVPVPKANVISVSGMVTGSRKLQKHKATVLIMVYNICQVLKDQNRLATADNPDDIVQAAFANPRYRNL